jgi:hypothetical protein
MRNNAKQRKELTVSEQTYTEHQNTSPVAMDEDISSPAYTNGGDANGMSDDFDFTDKKLRNVGPRKLTRKEALLCDAIAKHIGENEPVTKVIGYMELEKPIRLALSPSIKGNLIQRGIFEPIYDDEHRLDGIKFTEAGYGLYQTRIDRIRSGEDTGEDEPVTRRPRKNGESVTRRGKFDIPGVKLRVLTDSNPRREGTHGYYSFQLYQDGQTFRDYMAADWKSKLPDVKLKTTLKPWDGPRLDHFNWDLKEGNIGLYNENEPEFLENGQPNPNYWVINNANGLKRLRQLQNA